MSWWCGRGGDSPPYADLERLVDGGRVIVVIVRALSATAAAGLAISPGTHFFILVALAGAATGRGDVILCAGVGVLAGAAGGGVLVRAAGFRGIFC